MRRADLTLIPEGLPEGWWYLTCFFIPASGTDRSESDSEGEVGSKDLGGTPPASRVAPVGMQHTFRSLPILPLFPEHASIHLYQVLSLTAMISSCFSSWNRVSLVHRRLKDVRKSSSPLQPPQDILLKLFLLSQCRQGCISVIGWPTTAVKWYTNDHVQMKSKTFTVGQRRPAEGDNDAVTLISATTPAGQPQIVKTMALKKVGMYGTM